MSLEISSSLSKFSISLILAIDRFQDGVKVVLGVVLAAKTALSWTAHASRVHERQPRAREHDGRCHLLLRVRGPRHRFFVMSKKMQ